MRTVGLPMAALLAAALALPALAEQGTNAERGYDTPPASDNGQPPSDAATAADQEDADLGAAMRAALNKDNNGSASGSSSASPSGEIYGPPLPPRKPSQAQGNNASTGDPFATGGVDSPEGFAQTQADHAATQLLAAGDNGGARVGNSSRSLPPPAPAAASGPPRSLATSAKGNGGVQAPAAASATGPSGGTPASTNAPGGPVVASAPKGAILDVNDPDQMGAAIATFAGLVHEEGKLNLERQALQKAAQPAALRLPVAPDRHEPVTDGEDPWSQPFDGRGDEDTVVPVRDTFRGVPLSGDRSKGA